MATGNVPVAPGPAFVVDDAEYRRDASQDVVAVSAFDEEPDPVRHLRVAFPALTLPLWQ